MQSILIYFLNVLALLEFVNGAYGGHVPPVDLGYAVYAPTNMNETTGYVSYDNIRYAAAPLGKLRFAPPAAPVQVRASGLINGSSIKNICPQANISWAFTAIPGLGDDAKYSIVNIVEPFNQSEDCLFLDVRTPRKSFDRRRFGKKLAPVLVYIHGGGNVVGNKALPYDSTGLLAEGGGDMVFVALQYRDTKGKLTLPTKLGAFGWLADPGDIQDITPNLGLLDQRAALVWIQRYISRFGGDPKQVTLMGESSGGASVLLQSTAYGGEKDTRLFKRIISQSPFIVNITKSQQKRAFKDFLNALNVSSIANAKQLPTEDLVSANSKVIEGSAYGTFTFGPVIDGGLVPEYPSKLLLQGKCNRKVSIMAAHNSNEGRLFTNQSAALDSSYLDYLRTTYPAASSSTLAYVNTTLYPPVYDGSQPYKTPLDRLTLTIAESEMTCQSYAAARAFPAHGFEYVLAVPPGLHFQDNQYVFNDGRPAPWVNRTLSSALQRYIANFAKTGDPNGGRKGAAVPASFPPFSEKKESLVLANDGVKTAKTRDEKAVKRCEFWANGDIYA
ncbi:MAG: hypothetical protein M1833_006884 [Piccolia ochrophora]|nr:MAG: hypothetical protein M1833_006884 [Piccolia ochrophora]